MGTAIKLTIQELDDLIDREARGRLGISGAEFRFQWQAGLLRESFAAEEIAMLLRLDSRYARHCLAGGVT